MRATLFDTNNPSQFALSQSASSNPPEPSTIHPETGFQSRFERATVLKVFVALAAVTFLLRIFYAGHLYQDGGLWFVAAEEILRGKALYREIYFDKPPAIALVYAGLFKLFGARILTICLFTIVYSILISVVLYLFGKWLFDRRVGLIAAAMFAVFSTTNQAGHVQGLNTDFLMVLPYAAGAYLLVRSRADAFHRKLTRRQGAWLALCGGALTGIAFQVNPKAAFDLVFFALFLFIARAWQVRPGEAEKEEAGALQPGAASLTLHLSSSLLFAAALAGFAIGALPFLICIAATKSLSFYWLYVWDWGARYARYYPAWKLPVSALTQSFDYFALNNTLLVTLVFVIVTTIKQSRKRRLKQSDTEPASEANFRANVTLLTWLAVSYAGLAVGGRFFGHYFFQILPSLCLIGARGLTGIVSAFKTRNRTAHAEPGRRTRAWNLRYALLALLVIGFVITLVRFHTRTVILAADWARGTTSAQTRDWFHEKLNREERMVAAAVRNLGEGPQAADHLDAEAMREDSPRESSARGPSDYLFVWGYRPEIYYWSGLIPASKYLSTQPLTGVPADVHYFGEEYHSVLDESVTAAERAELAQELEQTRPEYIVDELGSFNADLSINSYAELREVMTAYKNLGMVERFVIYRRKDFTKGYRKRNPEAKP